ncbi:uncharacterized protein LOC130723215 [Lotus japonicus]|uniref:uncharacterized protein LOC130723215 n=1 Tax=Lotus japonicus TaxID=34305 RepID=UPI002582F711|nr:uncharacterized protein LOC130723215 [Lotus japonicus]
MKLNKNNNNQIPFINLSLLSTIILICFTIDKCGAHQINDTSPKIETKSANSHHAHPPKESHHAHPPKASHHAHPPKASHHAQPPKASHHAQPPKASHHAHPPKASHHAQPPKASHHAHPPKASHHAHSPKASHVEKPISFPPSGAPQAQNPSSGEDNSGHSSSFSDAFSDILKGDLDHDHKSDKKHNKNNKNTALQQICSRTHYPGICLATIPHLLNHKTKIDVVSVLEASIKACSFQVKLTMSKVAKHSAKSPELADALGDCKEKYHNVLKNLRKAMHAVSSHDFGKVNMILSGVMADVSTCESQFEDLKSSPIKSKSHGLVSIMVNNCLSLTSLIHH